MCAKDPGETRAPAARKGEDKLRGTQAGRARGKPRCLEALSRKERVAVAALVELVWGANSFTGDGVLPKVRAALYSKG